MGIDMREGERYMGSPGRGVLPGFTDRVTTEQPDPSKMEQHGSGPGKFTVYDGSKLSMNFQHNNPG